MANKNLNTPPYEDEEIFFMTPEEKLWEFKRLNTMQCGRHFQGALNNPDKTMKYMYCIAYHISPSARKCISKEFLDSDDDPSEEFIEEMNQCLDSNETATKAFHSFYNDINDVFIINRPYMSIVKERLKSGNITNFNESHKNVCMEQINNFYECNVREARKRNISPEVIAKAIDANQSDLCFKELYSIHHCVLANYCAKQLQTCTEKMMKDDPQMSNDEAFAYCFNLPSGDVETCFRNTMNNLK